ncbi:MAG TPA: oligosaccharide flippase family protein [Bryobacteraceae bacterium]|nr:oligosaccharide flippase family protein [Bryobacteraceae bacterium]
MAFDASRKLAKLVRGNRLVHNMAALYGVQFGRKIIPLITIPYLARMLGAAGWGKIAFVTAIGDFVVILIEFGFNLSATREVARHRDCPQTCGEVMSGVLGAQALLAALAMAAAVACSRFIPLLRDNSALFGAGLVYGVAQGFAPLWFFQGLEKLRLSSAIEITGKLAAVGGMFVFVHGAGDEWKWMALCAVAPTLTTIAGFLLAFRTMPMRLPTFAMVSRALHMGWPMFLFRSAESLYGIGNVFLLGLFASPEIVGYFASAEKISKAAYGLMNPVRDAIYPRLSHLAKSGYEAAANLARLSASIIVGGGVLLGILLFLTAPLLIKLLLGASYEPAVLVLRMFSCLPVLLAITNSAGMQWLLPFGQDGKINQIILSGGVVNVCLSLFLAPRFLHVGMAASVLCSELYVSTAMATAAYKLLPPRNRTAVVDLQGAESP